MKSCTSLTVVLSRYIALRTRIYLILRNKIKSNRDTILYHHDNFRRRNPIASSTKNTIATLILLWSPSPAHLLQPSCSLVWSDLFYFTQNLTISNMQILLHGSHHDRKLGRWELMWEFVECKLIFIEINSPSINLNIHLMRTSFRFIPWSSCVAFCQFGQKILFTLQITYHELFMWVLVLLTQQTTQQPTQFVDCCIMLVCHYK